MIKIQKNEICLIVGISFLFFLFFTVMNILSGAAIAATLLPIGLASLFVLLCGFISVCCINHFYPELFIEDNAPAYTPLSTVELDIAPQPTSHPILPVENQSLTFEIESRDERTEESNADEQPHGNLTSHTVNM